MVIIKTLRGAGDPADRVAAIRRLRRLVWDVVRANGRR